MPKWSEQEQKLINDVRTRLKDKINQSPNYPEITGDRKIIRFLRGHDYNLEKVIELYSNFLTWRKEKKLDEIRKNIVENGLDHPLKFPKGEIILQLIPQLVLAPDAKDCEGAPLCVEQYNFSPNEVLEKISIDDYVLFVMYCLEYKSLIIEQMSEEKEQKFLDSLSEEERVKHLKEGFGEKLEPYGVLMYTCVVRDLKGVGFEHLGAKGQEIIKAVVQLASDNYPELMRKCYMINTPWIFNTIWYVVKGWLAARTIAKVSVMGSMYAKEIAKEIPMHCLPGICGGSYVGYMEYRPFPFNLEYLCPNKEESNIKTPSPAGTKPSEETVMTIKNPELTQEEVQKEKEKLDEHNKGIVNNAAPIFGSEDNYVELSP